MTDIDFEEIDKAVSSAMGSPSDENPGDSDRSIPVTVSSRSTEPSEPAVETQRSSMPAARRSAGRFMDVMHPSSDMKPAQKSTEKPAKPEYAFPSGVPEKSEPEMPKQIEAPESNEESDESQPLDSPFLSDAKVEKRPLGAYSDVVQQEAAPEDEPVEEDTSADIVESPVESTEETSLPAELGSDVLSIESKQGLSETPVAGQTGPEAMPRIENAPNDEPEPPVPSIVQQYKEQPSSASQASGAIFDTEQYHTPLAHAPKKHTGWLVVVWILALIIVGAGLGAAAYYFVLPGLI